MLALTKNLTFFHIYRHIYKVYSIFIIIQRITDLIVTHAIVLGGCRYCMSQESSLHKCYNEAIFFLELSKNMPKTV